MDMQINLQVHQNRKKQLFMKLIPIKNWFKQLQNTKHLLIAGPCSAETEKQVLETAIEINKIEQVKVYRAGIWKPRTRPNNFEGVGNIGLEWLKKVKEQTNLLTTVEVATPEHVELCLKKPESVDILWIGARTTANPFSIQELANSLKGVDIPVMIKNPLNPDLGLWQGAIERFYKVGISKIAAIHRGFYPFEKNKLRNIPKWEIPIELKSIFPELPIINDPSHISGLTCYIEEIAQKALAINMDGLMLETHIEPKKALSDAKQQITPAELKILLTKLIFRNETFKNNALINQLEQFREQIDSIDAQILELFSKRMNIVEQIGYYKNENKISIFQLSRWKNIMKTRTEFGEKLGLNKLFIKKILQLVHKESIRKQTEKN